MDDGPGERAESRCGGGVAELLRGLLRASGASVGWPHHGERPVTTLMVAKLGGEAVLLAARSLARVARPCCLFLCGFEGAVFFLSSEG